jgi:hypothetical protein
MAAPTVFSVSPLNLATDVVLGTQVVITFDQVIDESTLNESTLSLTGPGQTSIITPDQLISSDPEAITGREYITGVLSFATVSSKTVATFNPDRSLRPNQTYTVLLAGASSALTNDVVKNLAGEAMASTYQWSFTTGILNVITPPLESPLPELLPDIDPNSVVVIPRKAVGNDLSQVIEFIFPDDIDPDSFNMDDVLVSIEAVLGDPAVVVPSGLTASAVIEGRKLKITISGWPS